MADKMLPFLDFLNPGTPFHWNENLDELLAESKRVIVSEIEEGVRIFDKSKRHALPQIGLKSG